MNRIFTDHPHSVGETYSQHASVAASFGFSLIGAGLACLVHAALPFLFQRTASAKVALLYDRMVAHRRRQSAPARPSQAIAAE